MKLFKRSYDVFISYRRDGGEETAKHLRDTLTERGYKVFLDVESLRSGPFNDALYRVIDESKDFILILPKDGLDRCVNEDDWVRLEIEHAKAEGKNIVPIMLKGFEFPADLPESIDFIRYQNAPPRFEITFFDAFVDKLQTFLISKRRKRWKRRLIAGIAVALIAALAYGIYYFNYTYPLKTSDKNLVSDVIAYMSHNLKQYDLAGSVYVKEIDRSLQFVEGKTTDSDTTLMDELAEYSQSIGEYGASLTEISDALRADLMSSRFDLGELGAIKGTLQHVIHSYSDTLLYIRDVIVDNPHLRTEYKTTYLGIIKELAALDADIMFYDMNLSLLPVTNDSALSLLKNQILPQLSFLYAGRMDLTRDKDALRGKEEAAFQKYEKLLAQMDESLQREEENLDLEGTVKLYNSLISYRESRGMDASDLKAKRDGFVEKAEKLEEKKRELVEEQKALEELHQQAYERFKPLDTDDLPLLWGKGKRFMTLHMPEAAGECFKLYAEKSVTEGEEADEIAGKAALRFTEVCTELDIKGGVVIGGYEPDLPRQAVEPGDVIYEVDGARVLNVTDYVNAVAEDGVHAVKIVRFGTVSYELTESVIDKSLGRLALLGLTDEGQE